MRRTAIATAIGLITGLCLFAPAAQADDTILKVSYPLTGTTHIKAVDATAKLGPGELLSTVNLDKAELTANLKIPVTTMSFKQFGLIPVSAVTELVQIGQTTGKLDVNTGGVTTTSKVKLRVVEMSVSGLPVPVGPACQSASVATITMNSEPGFNPLTGGTVSGTYTIPEFSGCGLIITPLINSTITGPGNTISFQLAEPTVVP
ncbi:hypothetical protein D5S17_33565 [Pseudonocardiaceae bacterium YIM PH 21723]|nr:hypothetical protein D5S17_33565 [Pseudonocardiaceae bacterium YIM PH 21723]